jgi:hypothetical protein
MRRRRGDPDAGGHQVRQSWLIARKVGTQEPRDDVAQFPLLAPRDRLQRRRCQRCAPRRSRKRRQLVDDQAARLVTRDRPP